MKQRVASGVEPFLGTSATDRILKPAGGGNLLSAVESVLTIFLGKKAAFALVSGIVDRAIFLKGNSPETARTRPQWSVRGLAKKLPPGWTRLVVLTAGCYLALGLAAFAVWWRTDDPAWVELFFRTPGALAALCLATIELWFSLHVIRQFAPGEALRPAWMLIGCSAGCNLAGVVLSEVPGARLQLLPAHLAMGLEAAASRWREIGLTLAGTYRFALLAAGLYYALKVYRQSGFLKQLRVLDWILLAIPAGYVVHNISGQVADLWLGKWPEIWVALRWLVDPLLWLLLVQALLLFRSVRGMGEGWTSRCWGSYSTAVFLTSLGDIGVWAANQGNLPRPLISLTWYAWLPAAAAFALAPAYQLEAIREAIRGSQTRSGAGQAV